MTRDDMAAHFRVRPGYWFVPKLFGLGATPVTWQGWVLTLGFVGLLLLDLRFVDEMVAKVGIGLALFAGFTVLCIRKTDGGWHWRWGPRT